jgi:hypothetical protein
MIREGVNMGGSIAGPYGALGGLFLGAIYGLMSADSHVAQLSARIQAEQAKDRELEAQIEGEIYRQRELEGQLTKVGQISEARKIEQPQIARQGEQDKKSPPKVDREDPITLASLGKKEATPAPTPSPFKNVEVKDINGDGVADLWIYYNPLKPGEVIRQEESTKGDAKVDSWSYFRDGKLIRRELDTKGTGRADVVYYYDDDRLFREERDEHGDGWPTVRAFYQNGHLAKVEKDLDRDQRMDLWLYYDLTKDNVVVKEERDLNGDSTVDLWSYYENGRLVRRDVSAAGLEILSKQGELPSSPTEPKKVAIPAR